MKLKDHFQKCAEHHIACAKTHRSAVDETSGATSDFHKSMQAIHTDHAAHFVACAKACASNDDSIDDIAPGSVAGGDAPGGPGRKAFGVGEDLSKTPPFGIHAMRDFDKLAPTEAHLVVPSARREFIPRPGGPSAVQSAEDSTNAIDKLRK